jgi:hypothetical protein
LKFFDVPPIFSQRRGEAQSRGKREIRNELSFEASDKPRKKKTGSDEPESLASRIYRTLGGVPRSGQLKGDIKKALTYHLNQRSIRGI